MDIIYVYYTSFETDAAHANQLIHTCNALADRGHSITVACAGNIEEYATAHSIELRFDHYRIPISLPNEAADKLVYYLFATALALGADMLFTRDISYLRVLGSISSFFRPRILYEAHKAYHVLGELTQTEECRRLACIDLMISISQGVANDLSVCEKNIDAVIPDAADISQIPSESKQTLRNELGLNQDETLFVYSGSISEWKNDLKGTIKAVGRLSGYRSGVRLLIIGGDDEKIADLREVRDSLGIDKDVVQFVGYIPQHCVFRYLKAADIGLVPLKHTDAIASRYTSPLKLYEYLVSDLQVVAADVPAITTAFSGENHIQLYSPGSVDSMLDAMQKILQQNHSEIDIKEFSYSARARRIESVIDTQ